MHWIDASIIFGFIGYAIYSGFKSKNKASENLEEYFLAGRQLKGWQAGLSMAATQFASDTPLLVTGIIATAGIFALWQIWVFAVAFLVLGFILSPCWRRAGVLTDAELTNIRYSSKPTETLRFFKAIYFGTLFNCTVLAWVFFAAAKISEPFLLWNQWLPDDFYLGIFNFVKSIDVPMTLSTGLSELEVWVRSTNNFISVFSIVLVTFFYSTTGGLRAVVATDIFQLLLMTLATLFFGGILVYKAGGFSAIYEKLQLLYQNSGEFISASQIVAFTPDQARDLSWPLLMVFALQWLIQINSDGTGYLAQRSMACRSDRDAKIAGLIHTFYTIFIRTMMWVPIGLALLVLYPMDSSIPHEILTPQREGIYVIAMADYLPLGLKGLMITAMLAALASTVDTHLNWGSSYWTNDIYKRLICELWLKKTPSAKSLVLVARLANLLILVIALIIGTQLKSINDTWQISLLLGAGAGIVLILRWIWWRMTAWGEITCVVSSLIFAPIIYFNVDSQAIRLLLMAIGCTGSSLLAVFIIGPEKEEVLQNFYNKVRPPGFWGKYSRKPKADRRRFKRGLAATIICSISIFCLIVGVGSLIAMSPPPIFLPNKVIWVTLLLLVAIVLTPIWWKLAFKDSENA